MMSLGVQEAPLAAEDHVTAAIFPCGIAAPLDPGANPGRESLQSEERTTGHPELVSEGRHRRVVAPEAMDGGAGRSR